MPPAQCPACGRFLKKSFVAALAEEPAPCPRCEEELRSEQFTLQGAAGDGADRVSSPTERAEDELHGGGATAASEAASEAPTDAGTDDASGEPPSVRPPDLPPEDVRDTADDPLHGWDTGGATFDPRKPDRPPFPADTVIVAGAGAAGVLLGLALGRERRAASAVTGGAAGVALAAVVRRVWQLQA